MSIALYRVFKVQRLETDPGGGTPYAEQPPQYVEADNIKVIRDYLNKELIVAHNAPFDIGVLRATLSHYDLEMPDFRYMCSCQLSRRVWREFPRHSLGELCGRMGIGFNHHRAGDDAEACAKVVIKASERIEVASIADLISFTGTPVKSFKIF